MKCLICKSNLYKTIDDGYLVHISCNNRFHYILVCENNTIKAENFYLEDFILRREIGKSFIYSNNPTKLLLTLNKVISLEEFLSKKWHKLLVLL